MNKKPSRSLLLLFIPTFFSAMLVGCDDSSSLVNQISGHHPLKDKRVFPSERLRGYGTLSGEQLLFTNERDNRFSILKIVCDTPSKAAIVQAKYASDLLALGNVSKQEMKIGDKTIPYYHAEAQGDLFCARIATDVYIIGSQVPNTLSTLLSPEILSETPNIEFTSDAKVPMYLDSWDQYAFRFYYRPGELPKDKKKREDYNPLTEFDYAKKHGDLGFVFWASQDKVDLAEGFNQNLVWDWAARAAERNKLPTIINTMSGPGTWLLNKHRDQTRVKMPQYCGSFHSIAEPYHGGVGSLSWCATTGKDEELALLKKIVETYSAKENTLEYLEPHGELDHGAYNVFLEYGPIADESYRKFLKNKYKSLSNLSDRWYGKPNQLKSWDDVTVPEVASFLGWNKTAVDLTGKWRFANFKGSYPADWVKTNFDDKKWAEIQAPGNDKTMFVKKEPAVYRQSVKVDEKWLEEHKNIWLYIWDLNRGEHLKEKITAFVNGVKAGEDLTLHARPHWSAFPVEKLLKAGDNQISLVLPQGFLAYRVYMSPDAPKQYPDLGKYRNAQWVDFTDWRSWTRLDMCRRGMEMIREVDPDRSIVCMAPDGYVAGIKELCEDYGAHFHNTGHMGGFWNDYLPSLMRGSNLPFSLEPGGPAKDLPGFKMQMAYYLTEGINAIHYFIHIGSIIWNDEIRSYFEKILPMLKALGRIHPPKAEIAFLHSDRISKLTGYPWGKDPNTNINSGYMSWRITSWFMNQYRMDGITDRDFERGHADDYKLIYDSNTSIMDEKLVGDIKKWVEEGGIFVAFVQSGRHTPEEKDAWPISSLSGYEVTEITPYNSDGTAAKSWNVEFAPNQPVFDEKKLKINTGNGLRLKKIASDARDLMLWKDGGVAAGLRKVGKGYVLTLGVKFCANRIWWGGTQTTREMFDQIFKWANCAPAPAKVDDDQVMLRQYVSNNGLFDVWVLWNQDKKKNATTSLTFANDLKPAFYRDVETGETHKLEANVIKDISIGPMEVKMFQLPRNQISTAAENWFELQRNWWRGTKKSISEPLSAPATPNTLDLTQKWSYKELGEKLLPADTDFAKNSFDDSTWPTKRLSCWAYPDELKTRHVIFRKTFTAPKNWTNGEIRLWIKSWSSQTVNGRIRVWLDGKEIKPFHPPHHGIDGMSLNETLKPGQTHTLAVEVDGTGPLPGVIGNSFLSYVPFPVAKIDMKGKWLPTKDGLRYGSPVELPGKWDAYMAKRNIEIGEDKKGKQVYLHMTSSPSIIGALINGHWVRRHHHRIGRFTHLNITPWIKYGAENEFEIVSWNNPSKGEVDDVQLYFYDE